MHLFARIAVENLWSYVNGLYTFALRKRAVHTPLMLDQSNGLRTEILINLKSYVTKLQMGLNLDSVSEQN